MIKTEIYVAELELLIKHRQELIAEADKLTQNSDYDIRGLPQMIGAVIAAHQERLTTLVTLWRGQ